MKSKLVIIALMLITSTVFAGINHEDTDPFSGIEKWSTDPVEPYITGSRLTHLIAVYMEDHDKGGLSNYVLILMFSAEGYESYEHDGKLQILTGTKREKLVFELTQGSSDVNIGYVLYSLAYIVSKSDIKKLINATTMKCRLHTIESHIDFTIPPGFRSELRALLDIAK